MVHGGCEYVSIQESVWCVKLARIQLTTAYIVICEIGPLSAYYNYSLLLLYYRGSSGQQYYYR